MHGGSGGWIAGDVANARSVSRSRVIDRSLLDESRRVNIDDISIGVVFGRLLTCAID